MSTPPYPTAHQIEEMFANRGHPEIFNSYLAENVDVLVNGGEDFHLGGRYNTVQSFHDEIYGHVTSALKVETFKVEVLRVIGGGESAWAAVESLSTAMSKYGEFLFVRFFSFSCYCYPPWSQDEQVPLEVFQLRIILSRERREERERDFLTCEDRDFAISDKPYADLHVDLVRFNSQGKIAQLREFFDTRHVHDHVEEHHGKSKEEK